MAKSAPIVPKRRKLKPKRFTRKSVLKMLAVMSQHDENGSDPVKDFLTTGRVGRRNALPDILGEHAHITTADLPDKMDQLTTKEVDRDGTDGKTDDVQPSTSQKS